MDWSLLDPLVQFSLEVGVHVSGGEIPRPISWSGGTWPRRVTCLQKWSLIIQIVGNILGGQHKLLEESSHGNAWVCSAWVMLRGGEI